MRPKLGLALAQSLCLGGCVSVRGAETDQDALPFEPIDFFIWPRSRFSM